MKIEFDCAIFTQYSYAVNELIEKYKEINLGDITLRSSNICPWNDGEPGIPSFISNRGYLTCMAGQCGAVIYHSVYPSYIDFFADLARVIGYTKMYLSLTSDYTQDNMVEIDQFKNKRTDNLVKLYKIEL